ncbi:cytochrome P450 [Streptomyces natalensis]|uniref:SgnD n=3 Tax=Streptomyces TaxID=1883 RepID=A0A1S6KDX5_9ACTN|nr:cytochrome P450 [Streptomyces natalensis]AQT01381.1 SgnD [Streptomyces gilvosporeus]KIZ15999.1 cytochrome P450 [Streptomyces natalensis ATCC 27448]CAC20932.1 PimD protein [Streptomyces natalensis]
MTAASHDLPCLNLEPPKMLKLSPLLRALQDRGPIHRVRTPAGDEAWLVTRHAELKQLLHDERIGRTHPDPPSAAQYVRSPFLDLLISDADAESGRRQHAETRRLLTPLFSARRVLEMQPKVEEAADTLLDAFIAQGPPGDLHGELTVPFALTVLCEVIGVPPQRRAELTTLLAGIAKLDDREGAVRAQDDLFGYVAGLVEHKRAEPGPDIISRLNDGELTEDRVAHLAMGLLFAGLDSVASIMDNGVVLLAAHPDQRAAALADPDVMARAVEEVLRTARAGGSVLPPRYASEDMEFGGVTIRAGDLVLFDLGLPNFDERAFTGPEEFDAARTPNPHLTFGHGIWHCIGAPLARLELRTMFTKLFTRLPELRPELPVEQLRLKEGQLSGGFAELRVVW